MSSIRYVPQFAAKLAFVLAMTTPSAAGARGAAPSQATDDQKQAATEAFKAGIEASGAGEHDKALEAFRRSYDAVASPNSHLMVARSLMRLGRLLEARSAFEATIEEGVAAGQLDEKYLATADAAREDLTELESKLASVKVTVVGAAAGDRLLVGDRELDSDAWHNPVVVEPGSIAVSVIAADGTEKGRVTLIVTAGSRLTTEIDVAPPPPPPAPSPPPPPPPPPSPPPERLLWPAYVAGGVGALGFVTFGAFGLMSNSKFSKLEDRCTDNVCPASLEGERDAGQAYQTVANAGLVLGAVGAATAVVFVLTSGPSAEEEGTGVSAQVAVGPRQIGLSGRF
jgi:hypothetical protein